MPDPGSGEQSVDTHSTIRNGVVCVQFDNMLRMYHASRWAGVCLRCPLSPNLPLISINKKRQRPKYRRNNVLRLTLWDLACETRPACRDHVPFGVFPKITESSAQSARVRLANVTVERETRRDRDDLRALQMRSQVNVDTTDNIRNHRPCDHAQHPSYQQ